MDKIMRNTLLRCPLCNKKLWLANVIRHRKLKHPMLAHKEFEVILIDAIKSGKIQVKVYEAPVRGLESGTQKLLKSKKQGASKYLSRNCIQAYIVNECRNDNREELGKDSI